MDKPKREAILDLSRYMNEKIRVKFTGGREGAHALHFSAPDNEEMLKVINPVTVTGVLKGFDQLLNLVLDDVQEIFLTGLFPC